MEMDLRCTLYFCYLIEEYVKEVFEGDKCCIKEDLCEKGTRLPYPHEIVYLYDIEHITMKANVFWNNILVRYANDVYGIMKIYLYENKKSYLGFEFQNFRSYENDSIVMEILSYRICVKEKYHPKNPCFNESLLFVAYGMIGFGVLVIFIYLILICVAMCIQSTGNSARKKEQCAMTSIS